MICFFLAIGIIFPAFSRQDPVKRVYSHLLIGDPSSAVAEAQAELARGVKSKPLQLGLIAALCRLGQEVEALEVWRGLASSDPTLLTDRVALEELAWGVLSNGERSDQLIIRMSALVGAALTADAKAIPLLIEALRSTNGMLRAAAVGLVSSYGDLPLQEELVRLIKEEKIWYVRLEVIKAIGLLKMKRCRNDLLQVVAEPTKLAEEKLAATIALVNMYDEVSEPELLHLAGQNRAGLRQLACQIIAHLHLQDQVQILVYLLRDIHPAVRMTALNTLILLGVTTYEGKPLMEVPAIGKLLKDHNAEVAITASWLALLQGDKRGEKFLKRWFLNRDKRYGRLVAGMVAVSGDVGIKLAKEMMVDSSDPYVHVTLAMGLIGQREEVALSCEFIAKHLKMRQKWIWNTSLNPLVRFLSPSEEGGENLPPHYSQLVDQHIRIELLQLLCIMKYARAEEAMKRFLTSPSWGTVGAAATTLLQEGDDEALDTVRALLKDPEEKVRIQAALLLALLGGDKGAVEVLKGAYSLANREVKIQILEALAKVGDEGTMAFLLERLTEPFQVLRVVAASAIIQSLYR